MELIKSIFASAFAMKAQGRRMEVIAQNIANADSLGQRPGQDPYQRQILSFTNVMNRELGLEVLKVDANLFSEKETMAAVDKESDLVDIVSAVANAEVTLDTVVTIRDRVIQAHQEIIRMPIKSLVRQYEAI